MLVYEKVEVFYKKAEKRSKKRKNWTFRGLLHVLKHYTECENGSSLAKRGSAPLLFCLLERLKMIALITGKIVIIEESQVVVDVNGVGYELYCSSNSLDRILVGDDVRFYTYTHVREDQLQLFGFLETFEKQLFHSFIKVNGIGPKMAMQALSGTRPEQIVRWIEEGDVKALMKLPKLGKKKAEQLVLTLKGKLVFAEEAATNLDPIAKEVSSALMNLGYAKEQVDAVLKEMGDLSDTETGVRQGLSILSGGL